MMDRRPGSRSHKLNDEFTVRFFDFFDDIQVTTQRLVEVIPEKKVVSDR
jgi:hypothetical protein